jgi:hypothetical protein
MTKLATPMAEAQARLLLERAASSVNGGYYLDATGRRTLEDLGLDTSAVDHAANLLTTRGQAEIVIRQGSLALIPTETGRASVTHLALVRKDAA